MRKLIIASVAIVSVFAFTTVPTPKEEAGIVWEKTTHDFGTVKVGPELKATFEFTNKGKKSVSIKNAKPGCSCTVPDYTKDPVVPGQKGSVSASYKTEGHLGNFSKNVTVLFDDGTTQELIITGNVITDDGGPKKAEFHNLIK